MRKALAVAVVAGLAVAVGVLAWQWRERPAPDTGRLAMPASLTASEERGKEAFAARCGECHGANGAGSDKGPPLVHRIYEPSHHPDEAFEVAMRLGARAHHWRFGDMPPVEGIAAEEIPLIIDFVRAVQRANGIH